MLAVFKMPVNDFLVGCLCAKDIIVVGFKGKIELNLRTLLEVFLQYAVKSPPFQLCRRILLKKRKKSSGLSLASLPIINTSF